MDAAMSDFLNWIQLEQENGSLLERYWYYVHGQHTHYNVLTNNLGDFPMYKAKLYIPQSLIKTIQQEYHDAHGQFSQTHT